MKKALFAALGAAFVFELIFAAAGLFAPEFTMAQFKLPVNPDTLFLSFALSWTLLFIAAICGLALYLLKKESPLGHTLSRILGFWWIAVGVAIFVKWGRVDNLFLDSLKGAIIVALSYASKKTA